MREEDSWVPERSLDKKCAECANVVTEGDKVRLASCEYGQPWFPAAIRCQTFEAA